MIGLLLAVTPVPGLLLRTWLRHRAEPDFWEELRAERPEPV